MRLAITNIILYCSFGVEEILFYLLCIGNNASMHPKEEGAKLTDWHESPMLALMYFLNIIYTLNIEHGLPR